MLAEHSRLYRENKDAFYAKVIEPSARLGDILILNSQADGRLRNAVNGIYRAPRDWPKRPPNSYSRTTSISQILTDCCVG